MGKLSSDLKDSYITFLVLLLGFNPVSSAFRYFPEEFDQHIRDKTCVTGDCYETWYTPARTRR